MAIRAPKDNLAEKIISINRVAKVVAGGRRFGFAALVAVGDKKGSIGMGHGKAKGIPDAIRKAIERAKKNLVKVPLRGDTIKFEIKSEFGGGKIWLKPASPGTGLIAGGASRAILELAGVKDVLSKSLRSNNPYNLGYATIQALQEMQKQIDATAFRKKKIKDISKNKQPEVEEIENNKFIPQPKIDTIHSSSETLPTVNTEAMPEQIPVEEIKTELKDSLKQVDINEIIKEKGEDEDE